MIVDVFAVNSTDLFSVLTVASSVKANVLDAGLAREGKF